MVINELHIRSDFRNLKGLDLKFDTTHTTNIIIGNNGAGKSNILEAFSSIFGTLYYGDKPEFEFDFSLRYHTSLGNNVVISSIADRGFKMRVDDNLIPFSDKRFLPKRVICNYSGEDRRIYEAYYEKIYRDFYSQVVHSKGNDTLKMVYVDKDIWRTILLIMLVTRNEHEAYDSFFRDVLGLEDNNAVSVKIQIDEKELERWKRNPNPAYFYIQALTDREATDKLKQTEISSKQKAYFASYYDKWRKEMDPDYSFEKGKASFYPEDSAMNSLYEKFEKIAKKCRVPNCVFFGTSGKGKTFLAVSIAREYAMQGHSALVIRQAEASEVMQEHRKVIGSYYTPSLKENEIEARREYLIEAEILVLDDLGVEPKTPNSQSDLIYILDERVLSGKTTIITTNYDMDALKERYGGRIFERLDRDFSKFRFNEKTEGDRA